MRSATGCPKSTGHGRFALHRGLVALCALATLTGGCANKGVVMTKVDTARTWAGSTFVDAVDATDKAFGESRVEDRQQIVRAKVGIKAEVRQNDSTDWSVPANFRIPLPALERKANVFLDVSASPDSSNLSDPGAAVDEKDGTLSATALRKFTDTIDLGATLGIHGGPDIGPELFARYEQKWLPWALFGEQRVYWRTDNGWGGRTIANIDYRLGDQTSFLRFANKADYYEELHDVDLKSGLIYRRMLPWSVAVSAETGVEYNPYLGDPEESEPTPANEDEDNFYGRLRFIGRASRYDWVEWEVMPGYYYMWEKDDQTVWGIDLRLSIMYESLLRD